MITHMLAGIRNRRSDLTYCNVTDTCCFYEITPSSLQLLIFTLMFSFGIITSVL